MIREVPGRRPRIDPDTYIDPQAELEDILKNARDYIELWRRDYR